MELTLLTLDVRIRLWMCVYIYIIFDELMSACANGMCVGGGGGMCVGGEGCPVYVSLLLMLPFATRVWTVSSWLCFWCCCLSQLKQIQKKEFKKTTTSFSVTVTVPSFIATINGSSVVATVTLIRKELSVAVNPL